LLLFSRRRRSLGRISLSLWGDRNDLCAVPSHLAVS
jgi:hypothetical protein